MLSIILVIIIAFLAGMEGVLDQWQFHQPIVACTLVGIATGNIAAGVALGGSLQLITLGWMNIGAAIAPDAALASVVSAWLVCGPSGLSVHDGIAIAIPLAVAGQLLTILVRTIVVGLVHGADKAAEAGNVRQMEAIHLTALSLQGLRIALPTAVVMLASASTVQAVMKAIPEVITNGLNIGGGMIVAVGYAMVINMMATNELWPWFFIGFALAAVDKLNLIAMGIMGVCFALIYMQLTPKYNSNNSGSSEDAGDSLEDELDRELEDL
ncbi:PTS mannose/fructose/sorbose transporter subunit IIC [Lentilactobacillus senioris]|uniref:PTS mannose/fructose/sorbose transporter subunit IIC n=1 Tax=Lentilactobacillus senioris TaxID=931534 RepID=UPI00227E349F|nr:PTS mannose/fructose/sorbose transporter subunit IIC [Lentilactobacillus senioris]MCY9807126.1 PTS mannose/fructose/sorbose transporter subunit IIC [Lentilactobacillus senioris]